MVPTEDEHESIYRGQLQTLRNSQMATKMLLPYYSPGPAAAVPASLRIIEP